MSTPKGHVAGFTIPSWGHVKSMCALIGKMSHSRPIYATILVPTSFHDRTLKEVDRHFIPDKEAELRSYVRVIGIDTGPSLYNTDDMTSGFLRAYKELFNGEPVKHTPGSDLVYDVVVPPQLLIIDILLTIVFGNIKSADVEKIPIYIFQTASAGSIIPLLSPENLGGFGNLQESLQKLEAKDEAERNKQITTLFRRCSGKLVLLPGLPSMYDYEFSPQEPIMEMSHIIVPILASVPRALRECDGLILCSSETIERTAIEAIKGWIPGQLIFNVGPIDFPLFERAIDTSPETLRVQQFLDATLEKYGPHSLLYISFGTLFFFKKPDLFISIIEMLLEKTVPFILSSASPAASLPEELSDRINESNFAYSAKWLPQTDILEHQACGWFVTHCGQNSLSESLSAGVPLICCPFDSDQPVNALTLVNSLNVAYELFELRSGSGLRPIHRLGDRAPEGTTDSARREFSEILVSTRGEIGAKKRENAQRIQKQLKSNWTPGGYSWKEIGRCMEILH